MKRLTPFEFIEKANEIHGDKYNYSMIVHVYASEKVSIICDIHGQFEQRPSDHLKGNGCPLCGKMSRALKNRKTTDEFIEESKNVHGNKYQYDKVSYINNSTKVIIICPKHGDFQQIPSSHLSDRGCTFCAGSEVLTSESFILKAKQVHNKKYNYDKVNYINSKAKLTITCLEHGDFVQIPSKHLIGQGCPKCAGKIKSNTKEFINKSQLKHGDKYDYSKANYLNRSTKVTITCPKHGDFEQAPSNHLMGQGCRVCAGNKELTTDIFISKANNKHENKYSYSKTAYINYGKKVVITCPKHGDFEQTPRDHLSGYGCKICGNNTKHTTDEFIEKAREIHGKNYNYEKVKYQDIKSKVTITCPFHGDFEQAPSNHLEGQGCPVCRIPKGELAIMKALQKRKVRFESQYTFNDCVYKKKLPFDFAIFIDDQLRLIEYHGEQHYRTVNYGNRQTSLELRKQLDKIKQDYAKNHNYPLLVISYTDFANIDNMIVSFITSQPA